MTAACSRLQPQSCSRLHGSSPARLEPARRVRAAFSEAEETVGPAIVNAWRAHRKKQVAPRARFLLANSPFIEQAGTVRRRGERREKVEEEGATVGADPAMEVTAEEEGSGCWSAGT